MEIFYDLSTFAYQHFVKISVILFVILEILGSVSTPQMPLSCLKKTDAIYRLSTPN